MTKNMHKTLTGVLLLLCSITLPAQEKLTLNEAVEIALSNNFDIRIAKNNLLIVREQNSAGQAGFLPTLSANFSTQNNINNSEQELYSGDIRQGDQVKSSGLNAGIQLGWTIFDGFNMFITREKLAELEKAGELNARIMVEDVVFRTILYYHTIVLEQKRLDVIKNAVAISVERKEIAAQKYGIGSGSGLELLQASVDLNADSSALLQQEYNLLDAMIVFNELLARQPDTKFVVEESIVIRDDLTFDNLSNLVQEQNPEIALAKIDANVEYLALKQQRSDLYPSISVNSGYSYQHSTSEIGIIRYGQNSGIYYGLTASWTIFNGFNRTRNLRIAQINASNSELELEQTRLRIRNELYRLFAAWHKGASTLKAERKNLAVAVETLNAAREKMALGSISSLDLREAQRNMIHAEFRLISAEFETKISETQLLQLCGMLMNP
jgi:outer membrane protein